SHLQGYQVDGLLQKLIVSLYADNTTVYLSEGDLYGDLLKLLEDWCLALGAKFNVLKTEIIPLGTEEYRRGLIDSRKLNDADTAIPTSIRIAEDGAPTRILGSWPGNALGSVNAWSVVVEKVEKDLSKWNRTHPTLNGRALIAQIVVGGYTQFLTAAEGMLLNVEKKLDRLITEFVWQDSKPHPINIDTMQRVRENGGLNLLQVRERNDAQYMVWFGAYLSEGPERPRWAFVADGIFRATI
ncbi:hypothetical protein AURDEDRAFT_73473, partial [Auricularia subglabra TFB-10046 SS5]